MSCYEGEKKKSLVNRNKEQGLQKCQRWLIIIKKEALKVAQKEILLTENGEPLEMPRPGLMSVKGGRKAAYLGTLQEKRSGTDHWLLSSWPAAPAPLWVCQPWELLWFRGFSAHAKQPCWSSGNTRGTTACFHANVFCCLFPSHTANDSSCLHQPHLEYPNPQFNKESKLSSIRLLRSLFLSVCLQRLM